MTDNNVGVGEAVQPVVNLAELQLEAFDGVFGLLVTVSFQPADFLPAVLLLVGEQPHLFRSALHDSAIAPRLPIISPWPGVSGGSPRRKLTNFAYLL